MTIIVGVDAHVRPFKTDGPCSGLITRFRTGWAYSGLTKTYAIEHPGELAVEVQRRSYTPLDPTHPVRRQDNKEKNFNEV